jgi:hypothetical protein
MYSPARPTAMDVDSQSMLGLDEQGISARDPESIDALDSLGM